MAEISADVWVITEGRQDFPPEDGFVGVCTPSDPPRNRVLESSAAIWARTPLRALAEPAPCKRGSVVAIVESAVGPVLVYGNVIAYAGSKRHIDGRPATRQWEVHEAEIERQVSEWRWLRERFPALPFVVAGDFNMTLGVVRRYGLERLRRRLREGLRAADLRCLTDEDVDANGKLPGRQLVDHVCISAHFEVVGDIECYAPLRDGLELSDHPALAVTLRVRSHSP